MPNYNNSFIYKIVCKDITISDIYVGSTTNFNKRKNCHKNNVYNKNFKSYNYNLYKFIRANGNWENFSMILVEKISCNDKIELHKIERKYMEELNATLNKQNPAKTPQEKLEYSLLKAKEYRELNKEYYDNYRVNNKKTINKKIVCECGATIFNRNRFVHYQTNKHQLKMLNLVISS